MPQDTSLAVAQIVGAIIAKGFDKETDGCDLRFEDHAVVLVDGEGHTISLRGLIQHVRSCLE